MLAWNVPSARQYESTSRSSSGNRGCAGMESGSFLKPALGYGTDSSSARVTEPLVLTTGGLTRGRDAQHRVLAVPPRLPAPNDADRSNHGCFGPTRPVLLGSSNPFFRLAPR